jgi:hypothetical protein
MERSCSSMEMKDVDEDDEFDEEGKKPRIMKKMKA